jgi:3-phenylpropionate/trans-cinnamate dioxygenase ferredoxin reductase subunit
MDSRYLVVGGGLAADAACKAIRYEDPDGVIVLVGEEPSPPYARPPLSKALWKGDDESTIWCGTADFDVDLRLGRRVVALDVNRQAATDDRGTSYTYDRLLLATGGRPRRPPFGGDDDVIFFRTVADYRHLRTLAYAGARCVVIGGGFIGSEIAAALAMTGCSVSMVFPSPGIGARVFPAELADAVGTYYREHGVELFAGASVTGIERHCGRKRVLLADGRVLEADAVVAGLGIEPNTELAAGAGLPVANGIIVDEFGRVTGHQNVFAAGDVARFPLGVHGGPVRVEHEDHAVAHGRRVGANMAGDNEAYEHLPFFYSDLFDLGYEAVGELDPRLETVNEVAGVLEPGIVYYVDGEHRARGVLLWNLFGRVDDARALIRAGAPVRSGALGERVA